MQSVRFTLQKAVMASVGGREFAEDNDPWRVSAFISALMELFVSLLLLLGVAIAFITSQLVNFFGLEPPCTYIGCYHNFSSRFRREHPPDHGKRDFLYELCPDCRYLLGCTKRSIQKFLLSKDDTDESFSPEGDDISLNGSSISTSDADVPLLDEGSSVSSHSLCGRRTFSSSRSAQKKPAKLGHIKPRASNFSGLLQAEKRSVDGEISMRGLDGIYRNHDGGHHYMLLEDADEGVYQDSRSNNFGATPDSDFAHGYMALQSDDEISEVGELHSEVEQPLLPCVDEATPVFSDVLDHDIDLKVSSQGPSIAEPAEGSEHYHSVEDDREPTFTNVCRGEDPYMVLQGDDQEVHETSFMKEMHSESSQALLDDVSNDECEMPDSFKRVPNIVGLFYAHPSSGIKEAIKARAQHGPTQEEQHHYTLLRENEEVFEAMDHMFCDCAQPLLRNVDQGHAGHQQLPIEPEGAKLVANFLDAEMSYTASVDLAEAWEAPGSTFFVTEEAIPCGIVARELHKQGHGSAEGNPVQELLPAGFCISVLEELCVKDPNVLPGVQLLSMDDSSLGFGKVTQDHEVHLAQVEGQLEELQSFPVASLMINASNKVLVPGKGRSVEPDNAHEVYVLGTVSDKAVAQLDSECESFHKEGLVKVAETMYGPHNEISKDRRVLDAVSQQLAQLDKEETQIEDDKEQGLIALREALLAERNSLVALEAELENERNAAAIATNEAMSMISRLQEEKSAMQLEVAQLQRMAEEKAEYDEQAMELLKEILFKREAEKHALEKEVELYRQRLMVEKGENVSLGFSTPPLLSSRTNEDKGLFSPKGWNSSPRSLHSLDEFSSLSPSNCQKVAQEPHAARIPQSSKSFETSISESLYGTTDQINTCFAENKEVSTIPFSRRLTELHHSHPQELKGSIRSMLSTNDEETQFILERLSVLEEELYELRGMDGVEAQKNSQGAHNPLVKKFDGNTFDACNDREAGGQPSENGVVSLPLRDVYEVESDLMQQGRDLKQVSLLLEYPEISEELKSSPRDDKDKEKVPIYPGMSSLVTEMQSNSLLVADQVEASADIGHALSLKTIDGGLASMDVIEQLAVRLKVLETDKDLLKEILESFRHRDAEFKLLQEIALQLRELRILGFSSISGSGVAETTTSETFGKSDAHAFKKRRYCSESSKADVTLIHQRSI